MQKEKISWDEMKRKYPNQWLLITDFELNEFGQVVRGIVECHSETKSEAARPVIIDRDTAFRYTGESTFAGLRSHAPNNHTF